MRFSEAFGIQPDEHDDWFDIHLTIDTKLFIDPLLLQLGGPGWSAGHEELLHHFKECYRLVARATSPDSVSGRAARKMLTFPEPSEFGLGYTSGGTSGAGSSLHGANSMVDGIAVAIAAGLIQPEHIEEVGMFALGIGADRISDAVCNVLKRRFIEYTQEIAGRHNIRLDSHRLRNAKVFVEQARWQDAVVELPTNPETGKPIILVPERLLNDLPVLNATDWFNSELNADLRLQLNMQVGDKVRKSDVIEMAKRHPSRVREWAREQTSRNDLRGYDFQGDPRGVVGWDKEPARFAEGHPIRHVARPTSQAELSALVSAIIEQFRHFIEHQRGWSLVRNQDGTEKPEEAAQLVFLGLAQRYLRMFDVEIDREVELGRGPVDFKVSSGTTMRLLIEVKKAHNGRFWHGLQEQLPSYLTSDGASEGWYVAIRYRNNRASQQRMTELPEMVADLQSRIDKKIHYAAIDARPKESASRISTDHGMTEDC